MAMRSQDYDKHIQFQRFERVDDGYQKTKKWADHGSKILGKRTDVSDAERAASGWIEATMASRFVVRSSVLSRGITPKDQLVCEGLTFDIIGIKAIGRQDRLEITGIARVDRGDGV